MVAPIVIDGYSHIGLPRFQTFAAHLRAMHENGIDKAVLSAFGSSPDLSGLHDALTQQPTRVRILGIPYGRDRSEVETCIRAQLNAGFSGLRLTATDVVHRPWILDLLAQAGAVSLVAGGVASSDKVSGLLFSHLQEHETARIVTAHFAGAADPIVLTRGPQSALFAHPRLAVVFSRHGAFPADVVDPWARALVDSFGWTRLMWGAEAPVLYWRNETLRSALDWIERLKPSDAERAEFFGATAQRFYFDDVPPTAPYEESVDPWATAEIMPATLWSNGLPVDQKVAGRLVSDWNEAGGQNRETLGAFVARLLEKVTKDD
jgi:hypothetical protein